MTNPSEVPQPEQPGVQPPASNVPPAGYQPPQGYQPPPQGYQAAGQASPQPGQPYNQPGQPGGFHFQMPTDGPRNFNDVLPRGGFAGMFNVTGLPIELKVSYWIWLIGGLLGVLGGLLGLFASLALFTVAPAAAVLVLLLVLVALAIAAAQIVLALKMKEGKEWARLALTVVAGVSLILALIGGSMGQGIGNNWLGFLISAAATVLMWLPNSQAWFTAVKGRA
jgi:hypothetical protein